LSILVLVVLSPLLLGAGFLAVLAAFDRIDPAARIPAGFTAYISTPSASRLLSDVLQLKAVDAVLAHDSRSALLGLVRNLRSDPYLNSESFRRLAAVRVEAALYGDGSFLAAVDLGMRSMLTRLAGPVLAIVPALSARLPGLTYHAGAVPRHYEYRMGNLVVYGAFTKNLVIIAASERGLAMALADRSRKAKDQSAFTDQSQGRTLRALVDMRVLLAWAGLAGAAGDVAGEAAGEAAGDVAGHEATALASFMQDISFTAPASLSLDIDNERLTVHLSAPASSSSPSLAALLSRRSVTPAITTRLPVSVEYYSHLAAGAPAALWSAASAYLGADALAIYQNAEEASRLTFAMGLDRLLFSWMGEELGVFGTRHGPAPVFFVAVAEERTRKRVFDDLFGTLLIRRDLSAVVDGQRIARIAFPRFMHALLLLVGARLVEPFYSVHDGFLYLSSSAEVLAACTAEMRRGDTLVKSARWMDTAGTLAPDNAVSLFYSLDHAVPLFARGSASLSTLLRLYRRGVLTVAASGTDLHISMSATTAPGPDLNPVPGYPYKPGGRIDGELQVGRSPAADAMAYWTSGRSVQALDLSSGMRYELVMDDTGWVVLEPGPDATIAAVWAVSSRGTIYRGSHTLEQTGGFPRISGLDVSAQPVFAGDHLVVPVSEGPAIMLVGRDGTRQLPATLHARARSRPTRSAGYLAVLPRSFDSRLYLFDHAGALVAGWPVSLDGIAAAPPVLTAGGHVAAITEAGSLHVLDLAGKPIGGFPLALAGSFDAAPAWAPGWNSWYILSVEGMLRRITPEGLSNGELALRRGAARGSAITVIDVDADGREELFISGGGDALYGYTGELVALPGFPLAGAGQPYFIDVTGDAKAELVVRGVDDTIHVYSK
jgi:hypothetical protein